MDSRGRSDVRERRLVKGRSKSAANLKHSSYYETFMFFEQISSNRKHPSPDRSTRGTASERLDTKIMSKKKTMASCPRNSSSEDCRAKCLTAPKAEKSRAAHVNFAYGRFNSGNSAPVVSDARTRPEKPTSYSHCSEPRRCTSTGMPLNIGHSKLAHRCTSSDSAEDVQHRNNDTLRKSTIDILPSKPVDVVINENVLPSSLTINDTFSRRCHSSPDISRVTPTLTLSASGEVVSVDSTYRDSHIRPRTVSQCSGELFLSRSVSPADFTFNVPGCHFLSTTCCSPNSEPVILQCRDSTELTGQRSEASIHLASSCTNLALPSERARKIHIIKTSHSVPSLPMETSTRLVDDWLVSVLRLREDTPESWVFHEDEASRSNFQHENYGIPDSVRDCNKEFDDLAQAPTAGSSLDELKQWSTTGTNTDISIHSNENCSCTLGDANAFFAHCESFSGCKDSLSESRRKEPLPEKCCTYCCLLHSDRHCSQVHLSQMYQCDNTCWTDKQVAASAYVSGLTRSGMAFNRAVGEPSWASDTPLNTTSLENRPDIMICISGDDDVNRSSLNVKQAEGGKRSFPMRDSGNEIRASPHYIFPSNGSHLEENNPRLCHQLSPRNSIGSICSTQSYLSSNADSAVDLAPPDDDFEYNDFLPLHHARRYSSINEIAEFPEQHLDGAVAPVPSRNASEKSVLPMISNYPSTTFVSSGVRYLPQPDFGKRFMGFDAQIKDSSTDQSNDRTGWSLTNDAHASGFRLYESNVTAMNDTFEARRHLTSKLQLGTNRDISHEHDIRFDISKTDPHIGDTDTPEINRFIHAEDSGFSPKKIRQDLRTPENLQHPIPELVISDHSEIGHRLPSDNRGSLDEAEIELESIGRDNLFSPIAPSPTPSSDSDLLQVEGQGSFRSPSVSSVGSDWSTCSTCTIYSDSDVEKPKKIVEEMQERITKALRDLRAITPAMLQKVWTELGYRIDLFRATTGAHMGCL